MALEYLTALPNVGDRRFGAISLGYDRISKLREESAALASLAALVMGTPVESLTVMDVANFVAAVQSSIASVDLSNLPVPDTPRPVALAWALATSAV